MSLGKAKIHVTIGEGIAFTVQTGEIVSLKTAAASIAAQIDNKLKAITKFARDEASADLGDLKSDNEALRAELEAVKITLAKAESAAPVAAKRKPRSK